MATIRAATRDNPPEYAPTGETPVEQAVRHVMEGEAHLERQRQTIAQLRADGHSTDQAETLLATLEATQESHKAHLSELIDRLEAPEANDR